MPDSLSELSKKYRDEMLNMYRSRRPPMPPPEPPAPPRPPHCPPCPPPPPKPPVPPRPPRPQPRAVLPVAVEPDEPPEQTEIIGLPEPVEAETTEIIGEPIAEEANEEQAPQTAETPSAEEANEEQAPQTAETPSAEEANEEQVPQTAETPSAEYEEPVLPEYIQPEIPSTPRDWEAQEAYEKRNTAEGKLYIVASTADSAFPVAGARVTVFTRIGDRLQLNYLLITDESGETPTVTLPAPPALLSQDPDNLKPYATCDIRIYASGYFREEARDVPIFAGVTSRQEFQMIPLPSGIAEDSETIVLPSEISPD